MNREYLVELAMDAYAEASGQSVSRPWMEAAFDAIAAHIWLEGALTSESAKDLHIIPLNPYRVAEEA